MASNIYEPAWDDESDREGFAYKDCWLGQRAGAERLGASLYELEPGQATFPYHWHTANEEVLLVLEGTVTVRRADETRAAATGEVVAFPRGERGAHQLLNRGSDRARFIVMSEMNWPDPCVQPDSGKVSVGLVPRGEGEPRRRVFLEEAAVDYWSGEEPPP